MLQRYEEDFHLALGAEEIIRSLYHKSQRIVSLRKERLPIETETWEPGEYIASKSAL